MNYSSKHGRLESNARFLHGTDHLYGRIFLISKAAPDYIERIKFARMETNVKVGLFEIMPNHSHQYLKNQDIEDVFSFYQRIHTGFSRFAKTLRIDERTITFRNDKVFYGRPRIKPIKNHIQNFECIRYNLLNPINWEIEKNVSLKKDPETGLYWATAENKIRKNERDGFDCMVLEESTGMELEEVLRICTLPRPEFDEFLVEFAKTIDKEKEMEIFKINPDLPWSNDDVSFDFTTDNEGD